MKAIRVRYYGPTNFKGSRLTADDGDGNRVTVGFDHSLSRDDAYVAAMQALCSKMKWGGTYACGWVGNDAVFVPVKSHNSVTVTA